MSDEREIEGERMDAVIKARIGRDQKKAIQDIARARQLKPADVLREALRIYLATRTSQPLDAAA